MADPLHEPAAGDVSPLVNNLPAVRAVLEAARAHRAKKAPGAVAPGQDIDEPSQATTVFVKNNTGGSLPALSVVTPTGVVTDPTTDTATMPYFARKRATFTVAAPAATDDPVFVTYDGLAASGIGRAVCQGVVPCLISVSDAGHEFARPVVSTTANFASETSGPVRIMWKESGTGTKWALVLLVGDETATAAATVSSWKEPVRVATTQTGTIATAFENGDTVDGVSLVTGDRILIKNQSSAAENGIFVVQASGTPVRATDFDVGSEVVGAVVYVSEGTVNGNTVWMCTNDATPSVGSTSLVFAKLGPPTDATRTAAGYINTAASQDIGCGKKVLHGQASGANLAAIVLEPNFAGSSSTISKLGILGDVTNGYGLSFFSDGYMTFDDGSNSLVGMNIDWDGGSNYVWNFADPTFGTGFGINAVYVAAGSFSGGTFLATGYYGMPLTTAAASAPNDTLFKDAADNKWKIKDSGGTVHPLW